eukprot:gene31274-6418_t
MRRQVSRRKAAKEVAPESTPDAGSLVEAKPKPGATKVVTEKVLAGSVIAAAVYLQFRPTEAKGPWTPTATTQQDASAKGPRTPTTTTQHDASAKGPKTPTATTQQDASTSPLPIASSSFKDLGGSFQSVVKKLPPGSLVVFVVAGLAVRALRKRLSKPCDSVPTDEPPPQAAPSTIGSLAHGVLAYSAAFVLVGGVAKDVHDTGLGFSFNRKGSGHKRTGTASIQPSSTKQAVDLAHGKSSQLTPPLADTLSNNVEVDASVLQSSIQHTTSEQVMARPPAMEVVVDLPSPRVSTGVVSDEYKFPISLTKASTAFELAVDGSLAVAGNVSLSAAADVPATVKKPVKKVAKKVVKKTVGDVAGGVVTGDAAAQTTTKKKGAIKKSSTAPSSGSVKVPEASSAKLQKTSRKAPAPSKTASGKKRASDEPSPLIRVLLALGSSVTLGGVGYGGYSLFNSVNKSKPGQTDSGGSVTSAPAESSQPSTDAPGSMSSVATPASDELSATSAGAMAVPLPPMAQGDGQSMSKVSGRRKEGGLAPILLAAVPVGVVSVICYTIWKWMSKSDRKDKPSGGGGGGGGKKKTVGRGTDPIKSVKASQKVTALSDGTGAKPAVGKKVKATAGDKTAADKTGAKKAVRKATRKPTTKTVAPSAGPVKSVKASLKVTSDMGPTGVSTSEGMIPQAQSVGHADMAFTGVNTSKGVVQTAVDAAADLAMAAAKTPRYPAGDLPTQHASTKAESLVTTITKKAVAIKKSSTASSSGVVKVPKTPPSVSAKLQKSTHKDTTPSKTTSGKKRASDEPSLLIRVLLALGSTVTLGGVGYGGHSLLNKSKPGQTDSGGSGKAAATLGDKVKATGKTSSDKLAGGKTSAAQVLPAAVTEEESATPSSSSMAVGVAPESSSPTISPSQAGDPSAGFDGVTQASISLGSSSESSLGTFAESTQSSTGVPGSMSSVAAAVTDSSFAPALLVAVPVGVASLECLCLPDIAKYLQDADWDTRKQGFI